MALRNKRQAAIEPEKSMHDGKPFTIEVSSDFAGFKQGDTLSLDRQIFEYYQAVLNEDGECILTEDEVLTTVKAVDVTGLSRDDADVARTEALEAQQESKAEPLIDTRSISIIAQSDPSGMAQLAMDMAAKVDDAFDKVLTVALDSKKVYDGAPLTLIPHLVRLYGVEQLAMLPIVGTRKQGKVNKKGQSTDNVDPGYNMPTDYYKVASKDKPGEFDYLRWLNLWVHAMPHVAQWKVRLATIKSVIKGDDLREVPEDISKFLPPHVEVKDMPQLKALEKDVAGDITNYTNRIGRALACWQKMHLIQEQLGENVDVTFVDETPEASAKRSKPIVMIGRSPAKGGRKEMWIPMEPLSLTQFLQYKVDVAKKNGGNLAALEKTRERGTKTTVPQPNAQTSTVKAGKIDNVHLFGDVLAAANDFVEDHSDLIGRATGKGDDDGALMCSRIVTLYDLLKSIATDETVRTRAVAYDQTQRTAAAAREAANAEAARVEAATKARLSKAS